MTSDETTKSRRHRLWKEAQANAAIEGMELTDREKDAIDFVIEQGMTEDQSVQYMKDFFHGKVSPPARKTDV